MFIINGCSENTKQNENRSKQNNVDTLSLIEKSPLPERTNTNDSINRTTRDTVYKNNRFRNVTAKKIGLDNYQIKGEAQIFEASFSWVVEDGHNELKKGFAMTDAGAPEWGKFDFIVNTKKDRTNSVLHLILFESSAKDGSRQYELPILLE